ncbi:MAG: GtrA family protein [Pedobacter sp.]|nr:GtrA family protein [Pedobacter sp.]
MRKALLRIIDFFYPPFSRWLTLHTFRYLASGSSTVASGIVTYYICYNWILKQQDVHLHIPYFPNLITAPTAALAMESFITFFVGFLLNKYLIFTSSDLKGRIQLFRYGSVWVTNILLNYALLKVLHDALGFYPTVSKMIIAVLLAVYSYFSQKYFTFRVKK